MSQPVRRASRKIQYPSHQEGAHDPALQSEGFLRTASMVDLPRRASSPHPAVR